MSQTLFQEPWHIACCQQKKFLYDGYVVSGKDWLVRKPDCLKESWLINADDVKSRPAKPVQMMKNCNEIVKGPYDLNHEQDLKRVDRMLKIIDKLSKLGHIISDQYHNYQIVLESSKVLDKAYLAIGYGGHFKGTYRMSGTREWSQRDTVQILISLMLKELFQIGQNTLDHLIGGCSGSRMMLFGLDNDETSEWPVPLHQSGKEAMKKYGQACYEYMQLYATRVEKAFGHDSQEAQRWATLVASMQETYLKGQELIVTEKWGWPVAESDRVVFKYGRQMLTGTALKSYQNENHVPLDCTVFYQTHRHVRPDDVSRDKLNEEIGHGDIPVEGQDVRPMTDQELKHYDEPKEDDLTYCAWDDVYAYGPGHIVKVFADRVNFERDQWSGNRRPSAVKAWQECGKDVGLVIDGGESNRYWRKVYCWKSKKIEDHPCESLYWVPDPDRNGRALKINPSRLEEDAPAKLMKEYYPMFADHIE